MKSLSEIDTVSKRASRALGFSWGVAEEVGKNIRLLEMFGLPGIKNLNNFFKVKKNSKFENLDLINKDNKSVNSQFCPISVGINFLDQINTIENFGEVTFQKIAYPLLFLPFVSRASEIIGKRLSLKINEREFLLSFNSSIYSNFLTNEIINLAENVSVKFLNNSDSFNQNEWEELYKLSEDTFVEESDSLKQSGAGAGLTDND